MAEEGSAYKVEYLDLENEEEVWISRAGRAKVTYENGAVYEGDFNEEKQKHGKGKYSWVRANEEDEEVQILATYEGEYKAGTRCGQGVMTFPNGDTGPGEWLDNKMHGIGTYKYKKNDDVYSGEFIQGLKDGKGIYEFGKDQSRLDGTWEKGAFKSGEWQLKGAGKYLGSFQNGQPIGPGSFQFINGISQSGEYKSDLVQGEDDENPDDDTTPAVRTWHGAPIVCA